jgi:hypothetical protein
MPMSVRPTCCNHGVDRWFGGVEGQGWYAPGPGEHIPEPSEEDVHVAGTRIAFFWDYGVTVPLWDEEGLLPDEPEWLERELGLSRTLIADLVAWAAVQDAIKRRSDADTQEEELFLRLQEELTPRFDVVRRW